MDLSDVQAQKCTLLYAHRAAGRLPVGAHQGSKDGGSLRGSTEQSQLDRAAFLSMLSIACTCIRKWAG